ncbi:hypothetical protein [Kitasatospora sp. NPDC056731]|uniref:hypothetical protein n=1 Tax=Kitasatospora sp. NPDC056731 TaxID=3155422 RepID=UPI00343B8833
MTDAVRDEREPAATKAGAVVRRSVLRAAGIGAAAVGLGAALPGGPAAAVGRRAGAPPAGSANLYYTARQVALVPGGSAASVPFEFYNGAATLPGGTADPAVFTFSTPFYTRVPAAGRPHGLTALYENDDPAVPSVYQLAVPRSLGASGRGTPATIGIPFAVQSGAPRELTQASAMIVPTGTDTQGDYSTAHHRFGVLSVADVGV